MNKTELISTVADKVGVSKTDAKKAVDAVLESIIGELAAGNKVTLLGFGTFVVLEKPARKGVNPATQQSIEIPAHKVIKFKPGSELAEQTK